MYKVMLVDDEPLVRQYLRMHIHKFHPKWEIAAEAMDGQEAWQALQQNCVDLVISDIKMPVMNGIELCRRIHTMEEPPQIFIISGYDEFVLAQEAIRYGVLNYLLKPMDKGELIDAIDSVTSLLDLKHRENLAFFTQISISKDSQTQVVKQFLKAVISESVVEIKTLYPLIFRLKVQLIETEGLIMLLDLDEEHLIRKGVPFGDFMVYRFILQQMAWEIAEETGLGYVFLDEKQLTSVLVTGEDRNHILQRCESLYAQLADAMLNNTGVTVTGALGSFESELFQLHASYSAASRNLQHRLFYREPKLFGREGDAISNNDLSSLDQLLAAVQYALFDPNEAAYTAALTKYISNIQQYTATEIVAFGIHMIQTLVKGKREIHGKSVERGYHLLRRAFQEPAAGWSNEPVLALFRDIASGFAACMDPVKPEPADEYNIANRAKAYICTHYSEPISLAMLADKLGVTPGYLSNTFHKSFQETYIKFLTRIRMEQAAKLLKAYPPEKVYDVAEKVGYIGVKHFSYVFKQHYQMPPGEYQDLHFSARRRDSRNE
jgi:two-component system, response regulator YesN